MSQVTELQQQLFWLKPLFASCEAMALSAALDAIWASQIPLTEKRRLAARAVAMQMASGQGSDHVAGCSGECQALEDVLAEVSVLRGPLCGKTSVSEAKAVLRQLGCAGTSLASRLGSLSKRRNAAAHPDSGLLHAVRALVAEHTPPLEKKVYCNMVARLFFLNWYT